MVRWRDPSVQLGWRDLPRMDRVIVGLWTLATMVTAVVAVASQSWVWGLSAVLLATNGVLHFLTARRREATRRYDDSLRRLRRGMEGRL